MGRTAQLVILYGVLNDYVFRPALLKPHLDH